MLRPRFPARSCTSHVFAHQISPSKAPYQAFLPCRRYAWYGDVNYDWDQFLVACGASVAGMILWAVPKYLLRRYLGWDGPGISGLLCRLPGFKFITGELGSQCVGS